MKIIGQLSHDQVFDWLQAIDFYIQPSLQEGLPRSVIEAMSYGLPCAGTRIAGIPELLDESMMFDCKSVKGIASILSGLNKEIMIEQAQKNFEKAREYDPNLLFARRDAFYSDFKQHASAMGGA